MNKSAAYDDISEVIKERVDKFNSEKFSKALQCLAVI